MLLTSAAAEEVRVILVGVRGLEPPTSASRTLRASRLRYTPVTFMQYTRRTYPIAECVLVRLYAHYEHPLCLQLV